MELTSKSCSSCSLKGMALSLFTIVATPTHIDADTNGKRKKKEDTESGTIYFLMFYYFPFFLRHSFQCLSGICVWTNR